MESREFNETVRTIVAASCQLAASLTGSLDVSYLRGAGCTLTSVYKALIPDIDALLNTSELRSSDSWTAYASSVKKVLHPKAVALVEEHLPSTRCVEGDLAPGAELLSANDILVAERAALLHVWKSRRDARLFHEALRRTAQAKFEHMVPNPIRVPLAALVTHQGAYVSVVWLPPLASPTRARVEPQSGVATALAVLRAGLDLPSTTAPMPLHIGLDSQLYIMPTPECAFARMAIGSGITVPVRPEFLDKISGRSKDLLSQVVDSDAADTVISALLDATPAGINGDKTALVKAMLDPDGLTRVMHQAGLNMCTLGFLLGKVRARVGVLKLRRDEAASSGGFAGGDTRELDRRLASLEALTAIMRGHIVARAHKDIICMEVAAVTVPDYAPAEALEMARLEKAEEVFQLIVKSQEYYDERLMKTIIRKFGFPGTMRDATKHLAFDRTAVALVLAGVLQYSGTAAGLEVSLGSKQVGGFVDTAVLSCSVLRCPTQIGRALLRAMMGAHGLTAKEDGGDSNTAAAPVSPKAASSGPAKRKRKRLSRQRQQQQHHLDERAAFASAPQWIVTDMERRWQRDGSSLAGASAASLRAILMSRLIAPEEHAAEAEDFREHVCDRLMRTLKGLATTSREHAAPFALLALVGTTVLSDVPRLDVFLHPALLDPRLLQETSVAGQIAAASAMREATSDLVRDNDLTMSPTHVQSMSTSTVGSPKAAGGRSPSPTFPHATSMESHQSVPPESSEDPKPADGGSSGSLQGLNLAPAGDHAVEPQTSQAGMSARSVTSVADFSRRRAAQNNPPPLTPDSAVDELLRGELCYALAAVDMSYVPSSDVAHLFVRQWVESTSNALRLPTLARTPGLLLQPDEPTARVLSILARTTAVLASGARGEDLDPDEEQDGGDSSRMPPANPKGNVRGASPTSDQDDEAEQDKAAQAKAKAASRRAGLSAVEVGDVADGRSLLALLRGCWRFGAADGADGLDVHATAFLRVMFRHCALNWDALRQMDDGAPDATLEFALRLAAAWFHENLSPALCSSDNFPPAALVHSTHATVGFFRIGCEPLDAESVAKLRFCTLPFLLIGRASRLDALASFAKFVSVTADDSRRAPLFDIVFTRRMDFGFAKAKQRGSKPKAQGLEELCLFGETVHNALLHGQIAPALKALQVLEDLATTDTYSALSSTDVALAVAAPRVTIDNVKRAIAQWRSLRDKRRQRVAEQEGLRRVAVISLEATERHVLSTSAEELHRWIIHEAFDGSLMSLFANPFEAIARFGVGSWEELARCEVAECEARGTAVAEEVPSREVIADAFANALGVQHRRASLLKEHEAFCEEVNDTFERLWKSLWMLEMSYLRRRNVIVLEEARMSQQLATAAEELVYEATGLAGLEHVANMETAHRKEMEATWLEAHRRYVECEVPWLAAVTSDFQTMHADVRADCDVSLESIHVAYHAIASAEYDVAVCNEWAATRADVHEAYGEGLCKQLAFLRRTFERLQDEEEPQLSPLLVRVLQMTAGEEERFRTSLAQAEEDERQALHTWHHDLAKRIGLERELSQLQAVQHVDVMPIPAALWRRVLTAVSTEEGELRSDVATLERSRRRQIETSFDDLRARLAALPHLPIPSVSPRRRKPAPRRDPATSEPPAATQASKQMDEAPRKRPSKATPASASPRGAPSSRSSRSPSPVRRPQHQAKPEPVQRRRQVPPSMAEPSAEATVSHLTSEPAAIVQPSLKYNDAWKHTRIGQSIQRQFEAKQKVRGGRRL